MGDLPNWLLQLIGMGLGAAAVYGGIRAEQKAMMRDIARQQREIDKAHERIDVLTGSGRRHGE